MKKFKKNQGITLIALVITVIVLLILAGISVSTLTGSNGILTKASEAKTKVEIAQEKEELQMAVMASQMEETNTLEIKKENLENAIKQQFGNNKDFSTTDNGDGSFLVNMNDTLRMYYVEETGEVIDESKMLKISNEEELKAFRDDVNNGNTYEGWYVYLANDITLDINEEWEPIGMYPMENSSPADETNKPFKGIFDGKGHEVDGIYINTTDKAQALFGIANNGKILNLGIGENCNIKGDGTATSSIVGVLYNNAKIVNCYNKSNIEVGGYSGGIVGVCQVNSEIINCYNTGNISVKRDLSDANIGGIVGSLHTDSKINNCYNAGDINKEGNYNISKVGGIVGRAQINSKIENSFNKGNIKGQNNIGGINGENANSVQIQNCYNIGNISGYNQIGGISGQNTNEISNCYNIGFITGTTHVGGITGQNFNSTTYNTIGLIRNSYSLENVAESLDGGNSYGIIENSSIKTEQEMKSLVQTLGIAFKEDTNNINNGYPILQWQ